MEWQETESMGRILKIKEILSYAIRSSQLAEKKNGNLKKYNRPTNENGKNDFVKLLNNQRQEIHEKVWSETLSRMSEDCSKN